MYALYIQYCTKDFAIDNYFISFPFSQKINVCMLAKKANYIRNIMKAHGQVQQSKSPKELWCSIKRFLIKLHRLKAIVTP